MENLTHSLVGGLIAQTSTGRRLRYATPTLIIAANLPDADVVTVFWGSTTALKYHRGITHSLAGIVVEAVALTAIVWFFEHRSKNSELPSFLQVFLPVLIALLSHPLLDWTNNYGIRPWLPWNGHWYYGDIVFIADPWLWLILGGGLFLVASKTRLQISAWVVLLTVLSLIVLVGIPGRPTNFTPSVKIVWMTAVALIIALRAIVKRSSSLPVIALAMMIVYWGSVLIIHDQALKNARLSLTQSTDKSAQFLVLPVPANPFGWTCIAETPDTIYQINSSLFANSDWGNSTRYSKEASAEMIDKIRSTETGKVFLDFARTYSSTVTREENGYTVVLRDLRFGLRLTARFNQRLEIINATL